MPCQPSTGRNVAKGMLLGNWREPSLLSTNRMLPLIPWPLDGLSFGPWLDFVETTAFTELTRQRLPICLLGESPRPRSRLPVETGLPWVEYRQAVPAEETRHRPGGSS